MAKSNDDLANALNALAAGQVHDDHPQSGSGIEHHQQPAPTPPPAARPASARPAAPKPAAPKPAAAPRPASAPAPSAQQRSTRPASPGGTPSPQRPAAPQAPPRAAVPSPARPPAPARPAAPAAPAAPPAAKAPRPPAPARPVAPPPPPAEEQQVVYEEGVEALEHGQVVEGEELDIAVPTEAVFRPKPKPAARPRTKYTHKIEFKQTIIPIMLTIGALSLISAIIPLLAPGDSNLAAMNQPTLLIILGVVGVLFLVFAVLNAMQVKALLEAEKKR